MKKLLLHTLLLSVSVLPAQVVTFTNEYAIWGESHCAHNLRQTIDGGYIFTADAVPEMDTAVNPLAYAYLVKIGAGGATQWIKSFPKSDFFIKPFDANCVCAASDGGYLMATCFYSSQYPASSNNPARILLVKTDAAGNQLWSYIYPGLGLSACYCVNETTDHGFIVCGETADSV
ncbi:MAG TPA: hypothetical protein VFU15_10565, partial [Bacteroidia bacterium]|nr:hypothetical protein [Bacteroidia bacterium]